MPIQTGSCLESLSTLRCRPIKGLLCHSSIKEAIVPTIGERIVRVTKFMGVLTQPTARLQQAQIQTGICALFNPSDLMFIDDGIRIYTNKG